MVNMALALPHSEHVAKICSRWLGRVVVNSWTCNQQIASSIPGRAVPG